MLPGIVPAPDHSAEPGFMAGGSTENLITLDGAMIYSPYRIGGFMSTFNPSIIDGSRLYNGGYPLASGGRILSSMELSARPGSAERLTGRLDVNALMSSFYAERLLPYSSIAFGFRRSIDKLVDRINRGKRSDYTPMPFSLDDMFIKFRFTPTASHTFSVTRYRESYDLEKLELGELDFRYVTDYDDSRLILESGWENELTALCWDFKPSTRFSWRILYAPSALQVRNSAYDGFELDDPGFPNEIYLDNSIENRFYRAEFFFSPIDSMGFRFGYERRDEEFGWRVTGLHRFLYPGQPVESQTIMSGVYPFRSEAPYFEYVYKHGDAIVLSAGRRWNTFRFWGRQAGAEEGVYSILYSHEFRESSGHYRGQGLSRAADTRLNGRMKLYDNLFFNVAYGTVHQNQYSFPALDESSIKFVDVWFPLDKKYQPVRAKHAVSGLELQLLPGTTLSFQGHRKDLNNMLWGDTYWFATCAGNYSGFDLVLRHSSRSLAGWMGYSRSKISGERYVSTRGYFDRETFPLRREDFSRLNLVLHYFDWEGKWEVSLNWSYQSGLPFADMQETYWTPEVGSGYRDFRWPAGSKHVSKYVIYGPRGGYDSSGRHRLDLSFRRRMEFNRLRAVVYVQVMNVYNSSHYLFVNRFSQYASGEVPPYYKVKIFPTIPIVGCQIEF
jgi:hypothetical protein